MLINLLKITLKAALLISYNDFIGYMAIGENVKLNNQIPTTHVCPISCMVYSPVFKIVFYFGLFYFNS